MSTILDALRRSAPKDYDEGGDSHSDAVLATLGYPKERSPAAAAFYKEFVADMKASGFAQRAIDRMGAKADGVVVASQ